MSPPIKPETRRALDLVARGVPLRVAADLLGIAPSTLVRARARLGADPLPKGRPFSSDGIGAQRRPSCKATAGDPGADAK